MRKEYDFSKGERGKFYRKDTELNIPICLDPEVFAFLHKIAEKKGSTLKPLSMTGSKRILP
jgi:hypothetical protein